jgi:formiminotetrahydrofolate cyclodeaminase
MNAGTSEPTGAPAEHEELLSTPVGELLDTVAAASRTPGGGSVAAMVVAVSAALVAAAARFSARDWPDAAGAVAQAERLRERAWPLAEESARAYSDAIEALGAPPGAKAASDRDYELGLVLGWAAEVPLLIAEAANDVASLARLVAEEGSPDVGPDAAVAAALAEASARAAAHLVEINLIASPSDPRVLAARGLATMAAKSAETALSTRR